MLTTRMWLRTQRYRDDDIGRLARYALEDPCWKGSIGAVSKFLKHRLWAHSSEPLEGWLQDAVIHANMEWDRKRRYA